MFFLENNYRMIDNCLTIFRQAAAVTTNAPAPPVPQQMPQIPQGKFIHSHLK